MDKNDLDPRTIDLNLNGNLAIEILYQYEYVAQVERRNQGQQQHVLESVLHFDARLSRNKSKVLTEMTSHEV